MCRKTANQPRVRKAHLTGAGLLLGPLLLGACSITPKPITSAEFAKQATSDYRILAKDYAPVAGPLTEAEAIARALKYNYNAQLSREEQTLQEREIDLALSQMLPRLSVDAGYDTRNNDNAAASISEFTRTQSLEPSYSSERRRYTADLSFSWNLLDVGVSYFQARQQGYRALAAVERRRKTIDDIVKNVEVAFWRAAVAQQLLPQLNPLLADAEDMLEASRKTSAEGLQPEIQSLAYQENLVQVVAQLRHMRTDMETEQARLASLIGVPPDVPLTLVVPADVTLQRPTNNDAAQLEATALDLRPELRQAEYQEKIDRQDIYKEIIKMMPGIGVLGGLNYDSDRLLFNHTWADFGVRATYNLVSLIQGPQAIAAAQAAVDVSKVRRLALGVAVITEFNISYRSYQAALDDLDTASEVDHIEQRIAQVSANAVASNQSSQAQKVRYALAAMVARYNKARAEGDAYSALANVYSAVGVDLVPPDISLGNLPTLTQRVATALQRWNSGEMPAPVISSAQIASTPAASPGTAIAMNTRQ